MTVVTSHRRFPLLRRERILNLGSWQALFFGAGLLLCCHFPRPAQAPAIAIRSLKTNRIGPALRDTRNDVKLDNIPNMHGMSRFPPRPTQGVGSGDLLPVTFRDQRQPFFPRPNAPFQLRILSRGQHLLESRTWLVTRIN